MIKFGELDKALSVYTCGDIREAIPVDYYRRVIKAAIKLYNDGQHWDINQAASVLLYLAFNDGHLHPSQLTASGLTALDYAEKFIQKTEITSAPTAAILKNIVNG